MRCFIFLCVLCGLLFVWLRPQAALCNLWLIGIRASDRNGTTGTTKLLVKIP